jgi:hypothetical protein
MQPHGTALPSSDITTVSAGPTNAEPSTSAPVLDRVAARVRTRLASEETASSSTGDSGHAASLTR